MSCFSINYLTYKDLKHLLKISQDLPTVSTKGLASINKIAIPTCFNSLIKSLEYVAKFNEGKFFKADEAKVLNKLINDCSDNTSLFSSSLH
ncbi:tRNA pseudouridine synthase A [Rickettsia akari str. Hartford]|uniref:tRNA pseudouridine synthase A n=1 Tax=Rickettsia akari (strain Hartford) TaxID=293614 RepID=A8GQ76_RICAH|nr:tRNA pseudouridine synthase A [Rickettsia akari str. Hartford]